MRSIGHQPALWTITVLALFWTVSGCQRGDEFGPSADAAAAARIRAVFSEAGSASTETVQSTGTGWATFQGRFVFEGTPPEMQPYGVNKDLDACTIDGQAPRQETLLVDSASQGIANVAIFARSVSRVHESAQASAERVLFDQRHCVFLTHVMPVVLGSTIELKNSDPVGHNTNIEGSINQTIPVGESIDFKPVKEAAVPVSVRCSIHPWMLAYLLPRQNGYVAITGTDGSFKLDNLPAGEELELQVWHESAAGPGHSLVLSSELAKRLKWSNKGRLKIRLEENEVREELFTVPAAAFNL